MAEAPQPWYEAFFGRDYLDVYGHQFTAERAEKEVAFVQRALALKRGDSILDLCCGPGRHSVLLARDGLRVTGQDLSAEYLALAQSAATAAGLEIETVQGDMREIPFEGRFDAVINMFTAFGYLESEAEDAKVLRAVAKALKPGGRLLMDLNNREWVVTNYIQNDWHAGDDGTIYLEHRDFDLVTSRNHVTFTAVGPDGARRDLDGHHIRLYTLTEMIELLAASGLRFEASYGDFDGAPYAISARRMIVVAQKR